MQVSMSDRQRQTQLLMQSEFELIALDNIFISIVNSYNDILEKKIVEQNKERYNLYIQENFTFFLKIKPNIIKKIKEYITYKKHEIEINKKYKINIKNNYDQPIIEKKEKFKLEKIINEFEINHNYERISFENISTDNSDYLLTKGHFLALDSFSEFFKYMNNKDQSSIIDQYEKQILNDFGDKSYNKQINFITKVCKVKNIHITITSNISSEYIQNVENFDDSNKQHLLGFVYNRLYLKYTRNLSSELTFDFTIKHKNKLSVNGQKFTSIGIFIVNSKQIFPILENHEYFKKLTQKEGVVYLGFDKLSKIIGLDFEYYK
jgi:hypothetical protein